MLLATFALRPMDAMDATIRSTLILFILLSGRILVNAASNDWVNPNYVVSTGLNSRRFETDTAAAEKQIIVLANQYAKKGPWSITSSTVTPPSGNVHDYLSWAPYHWPDCHWCPSRNSKRQNEVLELVPPSWNTILEELGTPAAPSSSPDNLIDIPEVIPGLLIPLVPDLDPAAVPNIGTTPTIGSSIPPMPDVPTSLPLPTEQSSSQNIASSTINPAKAPVKTQSSGPSKPNKPSQSTSCTPSPTKSMAPSATWTTCPYVTKDGKRNPDVSLPANSLSLVAMAQSVLYNSLAYVLEGSASFSYNAVSFVDTWFLNASTSMNPHLEYGQVVRGPGNQDGSFMGVLDARGFVQVFNGLAVLKLAKSPHWTDGRENAMQRWARTYDRWLLSSALGRKSGQSPNNHGTFWMNQMAALRIYENDLDGARQVVQYYFSHTFQDQVVASGEQPFEAVRTRPFHYRCFNLEGMIVNAKLADQVGLNMWNARSRYGATIQTATDFLMRTNPGDEDLKEVFPHVAAVAAAYGDPTGKYQAFLQKGDPNYKSEPYWFYDQPFAMQHNAGAAVGTYRTSQNVSVPTGSSRKRGGRRRNEDPDESSGSAGTVQVLKPAAFANNDAVELDDGVFVTWDDIKQYYYGQNYSAAGPDVVVRTFKGPSRILDWE